MKYPILISALFSLSSLSLSFQASGLEVESSAELAKHTQARHTQAHPPQQHSAQLHQNAAFLLDPSAQSCQPFCINPIELAEGVASVDELELLKFIQVSQGAGGGVIVDARTPSWYQRGTIPGSVNIPYSVFEKSAEDAELSAALEALGASSREPVNRIVRLFEKIGLFGGKMKTEHWDFSTAREVVLWCNDPWCGQSPRAIKALLSHGYPAEKLYYYRGGLRTWESLGLTTLTPTADRLAAN